MTQHNANRLWTNDEARVLCRDLSRFYLVVAVVALVFGFMCGWIIFR